MAKTKKPDTGKTIIDVAHPGKSAPSANSKSVIIASRPLLKDPMMVDDDASKDGSADNDSSLSKVPNRPGVQPLTAPLLKAAEAEEPDEPAQSDSEAVEASVGQPEPESAEPGEAVTDEDDGKPAADAEPTEESETPADGQSDEPDQPAADEAASEPAASPEPTEPEKPVPSADSRAKPAEPNAEEAASTKDKAKPVEDKAEQETRRLAAIEKLADSKKYYLPINAVEKRRSRRFVIVGIVLSLLLIAAWADIALDAGLIHINGVKPLTHFFSN